MNDLVSFDLKAKHGCSLPVVELVNRKAWREGQADKE